MKEQLEQRLTELKAECAAGQKMLADLQAQQANLQQTLLRISGAMQVLEELLGNGLPPEAPTYLNPSAHVGERNDMAASS